MGRNPFSRLFAWLLGGIALGGAASISLSQQIDLAEDLDGIAPGHYSGGKAGHTGNNGGARKYRAWKRQRASGITMRRRR